MTRRKDWHTRQSGFSLVELMVVVVILTIILGVVIEGATTLQRGTLTKGQYLAAPGTAPAYYTELNNVVNSGGVYPIAGNNPQGTAYDVLYGAYKTAPVFALFDVTGLPTTNPASVRTIAIAVNVVSSTADQQSAMVPIVSMSAIARLNN